MLLNAWIKQSAMLALDKGDVAEHAHVQADREATRVRACNCNFLSTVGGVHR